MIGITVQALKHLQDRQMIGNTVQALKHQKRQANDWDHRASFKTPDKTGIWLGSLCKP